MPPLMQENGWEFADRNGSSCGLDYLKRLLAESGVAETIDMAQIKLHYYGSHAISSPPASCPPAPPTT